MIVSFAGLVMKSHTQCYFSNFTVLNIVYHLCSYTLKIVCPVIFLFDVIYNFTSLALFCLTL